MASEPKTIDVEPGSDLDRLLDEAAREPLRLVRGGERFRLVRGDEDNWAGYDPEEARASTLAASGGWKDIDLVSYGEPYEGAYHAPNQAASLAELQLFLRGKALMPLSPKIMETFGIVRGGLSRTLHQQIGDMDLLIAATALTHNLTLLTRNRRDFEHVPDLELYRPT